MQNNPYADSYGGFEVAANAAADSRATFIKNTYLHLAGAVACFIGLEAVIQLSGLAQPIMQIFGSGLGIMLFIGVMFLVPMLVSKMATPGQPAASQYMGLGLYVLMYSVLFAPIIFIANNMFPDDNLVMQAGVVSLAAFGALTAVAFITKSDFSFLRGILVFGSFLAIGTIIAAMIFGFSLGLFFTVAMIALAGGYVLYDTSNVLHHYPVNAHVAASLALFGSLATLFFYILRLAMILSGRD